LKLAKFNNEYFLSETVFSKIKSQSVIVGKTTIFLIIEKDIVF